jgi:uncharacterized protein YegP (UPF0339 family)
MSAQYSLYRSANNQYYFNLSAENNEKILASELYVSKDSALVGIQSVKTNSSIDSRFTKLTSSDGKYYFLLKAGNNETIGTSETYLTEQAADNGIQAVKRVGPVASITDHT